MKNASLVTLALASVAAIVTAAPVCAANAGGGPKARLFAQYDTNKNGVIDGAEVEVLRRAFAADPKGELARYDTDKDGKLSDQEIALIKPPGAKKGGGKKSDAAKPGTAGKDAPKPPTP